MRAWRSRRSCSWRRRAISSGLSVGAVGVTGVVFVGAGVLGVLGRDGVLGRVGARGGVGAGSGRAAGGSGSGASGSGCAPANAARHRPATIVSRTASRVVENHTLVTRRVSEHQSSGGFHPRSSR